MLGTRAAQERQCKGRMCRRCALPLAVGSARLSRAGASKAQAAAAPDPFNGSCYTAECRGLSPDGARPDPSDLP